ncbi:hypothetical protein M5X04_26770 [Paenibacillus alvei]|uniref:Uncharacterized protein n=1 Tax=Paenibacillus alvei TaxID=44250 RepID=A0ABT4EGN5_PAEAL|nr:hypothetical protein [Paenibacillus alvei]MCY9532916.1 hypothetical protein [Paenibacillus alvei]
MIGTSKANESHSQVKKKRDLHADLAICDAATPGPWDSADTTDGFYILDADDYVLAATLERAVDATFILESRQGWPEAIRRAIAAEAENERLREALIEIAWRGYDEGLSAYFYSPENHARCVDIARDVLLK